MHLSWKFAGLVATAMIANSLNPAPAFATCDPPDHFDTCGGTGRGAVVTVLTDAESNPYVNTALSGWVPKGQPVPQPPSVVTPSNVPIQSADGCSGDVCIDVRGDGTTVTEWGTTAYGNVGCQEAYFLLNNGTVHMGRYICPEPGSGDGVYYDYTGSTGYYPDGSQLCNTWTNSYGRPCESVHS